MKHLAATVVAILALSSTAKAQPISSTHELAHVLASCWNRAFLSTSALNSEVVLQLAYPTKTASLVPDIEMVDSAGPTEAGRKQAFEAAHRAVLRCASNREVAQELVGKQLWFRFSPNSQVSYEKASKNGIQRAKTTATQDLLKVSNCQVKAGNYSIDLDGWCDFTNLTATPIARISYSRTTTETGRTVPWSVMDERTIAIPGGIEPGETVKVTVDPGFRYERANLDRLVLTVKPIALFDVNLDPIN